MAMRVEIAICTWNRSELLRRTLTRFSDLCSAWNSQSIFEWSLIVVDNNSSDDTTKVLSEFRSKLPLQVVHESQQGHTFARNRAIELATGNLLIWTDDDVEVSDNWLPTYVRAASDPSAASFWGSKIIPKFIGATKTPIWISENWEKLKGCFAERDLGEASFLFSHQQLPYGANFAVRTEVQKQFRFRDDLGRSENVVVGEDEIDMLRRMLDAGQRGIWLPDAAIEHLIDERRQSTKFIAQYFEGQGRALVVRNQQWTDDILKLKTEAKRELWWFSIKRFVCQSEVWLSHLIRGSLANGQWKAMLQLQGDDRQR